MRASLRRSGAVGDTCFYYFLCRSQCSIWKFRWPNHAAPRRLGIIRHSTMPSMPCLTHPLLLFGTVRRFVGTFLGSTRKNVNQQQNFSINCNASCCRLDCNPSSQFSKIFTTATILLPIEQSLLSLQSLKVSDAWSQKALLFCRP